VGRGSRLPAVASVQEGPRTPLGILLTRGTSSPSGPPARFLCPARETGERERPPRPASAGLAGSHRASTLGWCAPRPSRVAPRPAERRHAAPRECRRRLGGPRSADIASPVSPWRPEAVQASPAARPRQAAEIGSIVSSPRRSRRLDLVKRRKL